MYGGFNLELVTSSSNRHHLSTASFSTCLALLSIVDVNIWFSCFFYILDMLFHFVPTIASSQSTFSSKFFFRQGSCNGSILSSTAVAVAVTLIIQNLHNDQKIC